MAARNQRTEVTRDQRFRMRNGDFQTMFNLGMMYHNRGYYSHALTYFKRAAANEFSPALVELGRMYENGQGGRINYEMALQSYVNAYELDGNRDAENNIGRMLVKGLGVERDIVLGRFYFIRSASRGCPEAAYNLGVFHASPEMRDDLLEFEWDDPERVIWHYRCSRDWLNAPRHKIEEEIDGFYGDRDRMYRVAAANWYQRALNLGYDDAQERLDLMAISNIHPTIN